MCNHCCCNTSAASLARAEMRVRQARRELALCEAELSERPLMPPPMSSADRWSHYYQLDLQYQRKHLANQLRTEAARCELENAELEVHLRSFSQ